MRRDLLLLALAASFAFPVAEVSGQDPSASDAGTSAASCVSAFDAAQLRRDELRLLDARDALRECALDDCPEIVRRKCRGWLVELDAQMPSLAVAAAEADGRDASRAKLYVDGTLVDDARRGAALDVDPGPRKVRVEHPDGRVVEETVLIVQGEKNRLVRLRFPAPAQRETPSPSLGPARPPAPQARVSPLAWAAFGLSGAALVLGGVAGVVALARTRDLEHLCATSAGCTQADIDALKPAAHLSTAALSLAAASAAVGVDARISHA